MSLFLASLCNHEVRAPMCLGNRNRTKVFRPLCITAHEHCEFFETSLLWDGASTLPCIATAQISGDSTLFVTQCCSQLLVLVGIVILFQCLRADKCAEVCGRHEPPLSGPKPFPLESRQALKNLWVTEAQILTKFFPKQVAGTPSICASKSHGAT